MAPRTSPLPDATLPAARTVRHFFRGQAVHLGGAALLAVVALALAQPALDNIAVLGLTDAQWLSWSIGLAIAHQVLVWLGFRSQLGWSLMSRWFGDRDLTVWGVLFFPLLIARPLTVLGCGLADFGSLALPSTTTTGLGLLLLAIAAYTLFSVKTYFGMERASGANYFRLAIRQQPFEARGAFRWSENAMYTFAFLGLWAIALLCRSHVALVAALFQHAFIWLHWVGTERPDIELMYPRD